MKPYILPIQSPQADLETVGGKGMSLARLAEAGLPIPGGFHITTTAYHHFIGHNNLQPEIEHALARLDTADPSALEAASAAIHSCFDRATIPADLVGKILQAYADLPDPEPAVAVRSSATAEDLPEASFAGQQATYLNVRGGDQVLEAVKKCWASLWTGRAISYRARQELTPSSVALAVVVQLLVPAEASGILFTANPLNGARDQAVINAAWGLGESVVGGTVTPDTATMDKKTGKILDRSTAEKQVMTVRTDAGTAEKPVPKNRQNEPVLSDAQAAELVGLGSRIELLYGMPMDIEWVLEDDAFAIVQARPITALPEPPLDWSPPSPKGTYMRASVADLMPAPLSPLFISLGIPAMRAQMIPLGQRVTGKKPRLADDYIGTINNYAYLNAYMPPKSWWWILTALIPSYPKLLRQMVPLWREELHPEYRAFVEAHQSGKPDAMSPEELWQTVQELVNAAAYYICGLMFATMGASAGSEGLLTVAYNKLAYREGDPDASSLLIGWDNIAVRSEKSLYDLAKYVQTDPPLKNFVLKTGSEELAGLLKNPTSVAVESFTEFAEKFQAHLKNYGYLVFQLDFAELLPRDQPAMMLENVKMYLRGVGSDPYERQQESEELRLRTTEVMLERVKGLKGWAFRVALNWGQSMAEVREDALAEIGLAYPRIRALLYELGRRLKAEGAIQFAGDIFWLEKSDIDNCVALMGRLESLDDLADRVAARRRFDRRVQQATPPPMIPVKKRIMGVKAEVYVAHSEEAQEGNVLKGVATSPGRVQALARVLDGPEDFDQMQPGEVLVAGTTTPAWTPIFAMASAVVTDIGGPLSHGSIVAREYRIPAVMGTGVATKRIQSGQMITVDGGQGEVILETEGKDVSPPVQEVAWKTPDPKAIYARGSLAEHVPGPVSPLFATLGVEIANQATTKMWEVYLGQKNAQQMIGGSFYKSINQYLYGGFRMDLRNTWGLIKMSLTQLAPIFRGSVGRWQAANQKLGAVVDEWEQMDVVALSPNELIGGVRAVFRAACEYYTVIQSTLPAASSSEVIFSRFYNLLIRRKQDPEFTTLLFGFDTAPVRAEKSIYDIADWLRGKPEMANYVRQTDMERLVWDRMSDTPPDGLSQPDWRGWRARLDEHFNRFGRTAYEFDFANPTPEEAPRPLLDALKLFLEGEAESPYDRLQAAVEARETAVASIEARLGWPRLGWFRRLLKWAQETGAIREDSIYSMGMGHPVIRRMLGELGRRFSEQGGLTHPEDIYWLEQEELETLIGHLESGQRLPNYSSVIPARKQAWETALQFKPPVMLPERSRWSRLLGGGEPSHEGGKTILRGIGTSGGHVTAPACVLYSPADFPNMKAGDVLVAVTTNPAWTPLFSMASAVVTDIGGPLSHSSIVAREYGIPAVMAARNATRHIRNGQLVTVDGQAGTVTLENHRRENSLPSG